MVVAATKQTGARTYLWVSIACNRQVWTEGKVDRVGLRRSYPRICGLHGSIRRTGSSDRIDCRSAIAYSVEATILEEMRICPDDGRSFSSEAALRTHQGKVHGTVLGSDPKSKKGPRRKRCTCLCGFVHRPLRQIVGYRKVPMLDRFTGDVFLDPETGTPIEIFDVSRSIDP